MTIQPIYLFPDALGVRAEGNGLIEQWRKYFVPVGSFEVVKPPFDFKLLLYGHYQIHLIGFVG